MNKYLVCKRVVSTLLLFVMVLINTDITTNVSVAKDIEKKCKDFDYVVYSEKGFELETNNKCINGKIGQGDLSKFSIKQSISRTIRSYGEGVYSSDVIKKQKFVPVLGSIQSIDIQEDTINASDIMYYSKEGDIKISGKDINLSGIIYAPEGTIQIDCENLSYCGAIIAKMIQIKALSNANIRDDIQCQKYVEDNKDIYSMSKDIYTYTYDEWGNKSSVRVNDKEIVRYVYSDDFSSILLKEVYANGTDFSYLFNVENKLESSIQRSEEYSLFDYDDTNNTVIYTTNQEHAEDYNEIYTYDNEGKIREISTPKGKIQYNYDLNNKLISTTDFCNKRKYGYSYDKRGNLTHKIIFDLNGKSVHQYNFERKNKWQDQISRCNEMEITYDKSGNMIRYDDCRFSWEKGNQLNKVWVGNNIIEFRYDNYGKRLEKTVNREKTEYEYSGDKLIAQRSDFGEIRFLYDDYDRVCSMDYEGNLYKYVLSGQGDVLGIVDENGKRVVNYIYDDYGDIVSISGCLSDSIGRINPIRYRGYYFDYETGLYYLNSRYYNPNLGSFISPDNLMYSEVADNMYSYCEGDPINNTDETGHLSWDGRNPKVNSQADAEEIQKLTNYEKKILKTIGFNKNNDYLTAQQCLRTRKEFNIESKKKRAHFWSQSYVETDGGRLLLEGGGDDYLNKQPYGKKYSGAGFLQLTWKENYERYSKYENDNKIISKGREHVAEKYPWFSAGWYWMFRKINTAISSNSGKSDDEVVKIVTKKVNGGTSQLKERQNAYKRIMKLL